MAKHKPILATSPGPYLGGYPQKAAGWGEVATAATRPTTKADSSDSSGLLPGYPQNKGPFLGGYPQNKGPFLPGYPQEPLGFGDSWLQNYIANLGKQIGESIKNIKVKPGEQKPPVLPAASSANQVAATNVPWQGPVQPGSGGGGGGTNAVDLVNSLLGGKGGPDYKTALALAQQLYAGTFQNIDAQTRLGQQNIAGLAHGFADQLAGVPAQVGKVYDTSIAQQNALSQSLRDALQGSNPQQANTALLNAVGAPASQVAANQAQNQGLYGAGGNTLFAQGSIGTSQLINDRAVQQAWAAQQPGIAAGQAQIAAGQFAAQQAQQRNALSAQLPQLAYNIYGQQLQNKQAMAQMQLTALRDDALFKHYGAQDDYYAARANAIINGPPKGALTQDQIDTQTQKLNTDLTGWARNILPKYTAGQLTSEGRAPLSYQDALRQGASKYRGLSADTIQSSVDAIYKRGFAGRPFLNPDEKQILTKAKVSPNASVQNVKDANGNTHKIGFLNARQAVALSKANKLPVTANPQQLENGSWVYVIDVNS